MCNCKEKLARKRSVLPVLLGFVGVLVLCWLRRRARRQLREERLAARFQDAGVPPAENATDIIAPAEEEGIEIENIPEVEAGSGAAVETPAADASVADRLEMIEGIGPKINAVLLAAGIRTFAQLATSEVAALEEILRAAGMRRLINPQSWPEQADLAARGKWEELKALQKQLKGGRKS